MHHHVQAVTALEATHPENNTTTKHNGVTAIKRNVVKDSNNNNVQHVTKESLNVKTPKSSDEVYEYTLLGFIKFKSPIKWLNSVSIILIHTIFIYVFFTYPLQGGFLTTLWGE